MTEVESEINVVTRKNWSDDYSGLDVDVKGILKQASSNLAAVYVIQFDMSGFTSRGEAESMVNILLSRYDKMVNVLKDMKQQDFMDGV